MIDWKNETDSELIAACMAGDGLAWDALIGRYSNLIYAIPLRFDLSPMVADEIFQQTCVTLLNKLDQLQDKSKLSAWLVTVTRRHCIHAFRQQTAEPLPESLLAEGASVEQEIMQWEQRQLVVQTVEQLPDRCRELLTRLFLQASPDSYETLAAEMDIALGSIGATRRRCLDKLRRKLESAD